MIVRNVTFDEMDEALREVNKKYDNNIRWNKFDLEGRKRNIHITLRVKDSKKAGHSLGLASHSTGNTRRLTSACWHVHGDFFDCLFAINSNATIMSRGNKITEAHGNWTDFNCGSVMNPLSASEKCDCV